MPLNTQTNKSHCLDSRCAGCPTLQLKRPDYNIVDTPTLKKASILLVSESFKLCNGVASPFAANELNLISSVIDQYTQDYELTAAMKCFNLKEGDVSAATIRQCRSFILDSIDAVNPTLIITFGNLALRSVTGLSGITAKRGKAFDILHNYKLYTVVPTLHPKSVLLEPKLRNLFEVDIRNAVEKYVKSPGSDYDNNVEYVNTLDRVDYYENLLKNTRATLAIDIETTGLNFLIDKIHTVAISFSNQTIVVPVYHKDANLSPSMIERICKFLQVIGANTKNIKAMHNAKFDLKFLAQLGIMMENVWDTQLMASLIDENRPKGLLDLVKEYFPEEIKSL